jgi:hypothetical protein
LTFITYTLVILAMAASVTRDSFYNNVNVIQVVSESFFGKYYPGPTNLPTGQCLRCRHTSRRICDLILFLADGGYRICQASPGRCPR